MRRKADGTSIRVSKGRHVHDPDAIRRPPSSASPAHAANAMSTLAISKVSMYAGNWLSISFSTSTVTRRRASDAPAILATLRRNVSPAASRKNANSNAMNICDRTISARPDGSAA